MMQTRDLGKILTRKRIDVNAGQQETALNTVTSDQNVLCSRIWQNFHAVIHTVLYDPLIRWFKCKIKFPFFCQCNQKLKHCNYPSGCTSYLWKTDYVIR